MLKLCSPSRTHLHAVTLGCIGQQAQMTCASNQGLQLTQHILWPGAEAGTIATSTCSMHLKPSIHDRGGLAREASAKEYVASQIVKIRPCRRTIPRGRHKGIFQALWCRICAVLGRAAVWRTQPVHCVDTVLAPSSIRLNTPHLQQWIKCCLDGHGWRLFVAL